MASRLTVKGQATVPKAVREHLGVRPGEAVEFAIAGSCVELRRPEHRDERARLEAAVADLRRRRPIRVHRESNACAILSLQILKLLEVGS
jgi:AbrB family looped-hinge helix DNA binding protein